MKKAKIILFFGFLIPFLTLQGQNGSVLLQQGGKPTIFTGTTALADAHNAATNGDTLYLGRGFWGTFTLSKSLHIYGAGISPDSTLVTGKSGILGTFTIAKGANESHLEGFEIIGDLNIAMNDTVTDIGIHRMLLTGLNIGIYGGYCQNISVAECIVQGAINGNNHVHNIFIRNSILVSVVSALSSNTVMENNIFMFQQAYAQTISGVNNAVIRNNIFAYNATCCYGLLSGSGNIFHNNVLPYPIGLPAGTDTLNNYYGLPIDSVLLKPNIPFNWQGNYHMKPWRSKYMKGQDGSEVGIYGGRYGIAKEGWVPVIPHIQSSNIDANTDGNAKLKVNIRVQAQKR